MSRFRSRQPGSPGALVPAAPPDEQTYEMLLDAIRRRQVRIDRLAAEIADTRATLAGFETACQARVGDLLAELREVSAATRAARQRLARLVAMAGEAGEEAVAQVLDELGMAIDLERDLDPDGDDLTGAHAGAFTEPDDRAFAADRPAPAAASLPAAERAELKRLYRDLARRCHPDLADDPEERARREALMQRVNEAFTAGDADALRGLLSETESDDPRFTERPVEERLAWARAELLRLDRRLDAMRREMTDLQLSDLYRLWRRHESGAAVFDDLEADLEHRIREESRILDRLTAGYRMVVTDERLDREIDASVAGA